MIRRQHLALQPPPEDHMCLLNVSVTSQCRYRHIHSTSDAKGQLVDNKGTQTCDNLWAFWFMDVRSQ